MRGQLVAARARLIGITAISFLAITMAVLYVPFANQQVARASADVTAMTQTKFEVVYGKVTKFGSPVNRALVTVRNARGVLVGTRRTGRSGTYRMVLHARSGAYTFTLTVGGHSHGASVRHRLRPGMHLRVSAHVTHRGFLFLPFFHY